MRDWVAEDRRKLLAFARDMLNSDYAGHRLTFQLFAQSPPFAHLAAVYRNFDWDGPLQFVRKAAELSERVMKKRDRPSGDSAVNRWFAMQRLHDAPAAGAKPRQRGTLWNRPVRRAGSAAAIPAWHESRGLHRQRGDHRRGCRDGTA